MKHDTKKQKAPCLAQKKRPSATPRVRLTNDNRAPNSVLAQIALYRTMKKTKAN